MSIACMTRVWDHSNQTNSRLLLLLALADRADDDGFCWPGIASLAQRVRVSERQVQRMLRDLAETGELYVHLQAGRMRTNRYVVLSGFSLEEGTAIIAERFGEEAVAGKGDTAVSPFVDEAAPEKVTSGAGPGKGDTTMSPFSVGKDDIAMSPFSDVDPAEKVTSGAVKGDIQGEKVTSRDGKGDIAMSPEPSKNHQLGTVKKNNRAGALEFSDPGIESPSPDDPDVEQQGPGPPGAAGRFADWEILLRDAPDGKERVRVLIEMHGHLYPGRDPPDTGLVGHAAKEAGGYGRLAELLWQNSARPPTGDVLPYLLGVIKRSKTGGNGRDRERAKSDPAHYRGQATAAAPRAPEDPPPEYVTVWREILRDLRGQMTASTFEGCFGRSKARAFLDGELTVSLGGADKLAWATGRLASVIERVAVDRGLTIAFEA